MKNKDCDTEIIILTNILVLFNSSLNEKTKKMYGEGSRGGRPVVIKAFSSQIRD